MQCVQVFAHDTGLNLDMTCARVCVRSDFSFMQITEAFLRLDELLKHPSSAPEIRDLTLPGALNFYILDARWFSHEIPQAMCPHYEW